MRWRIYENEDGGIVLKVRDNDHMWFPIGPVENVEMAMDLIRIISEEEPRTLRTFNIIK